MKTKQMISLALIGMLFTVLTTTVCAKPPNIVLINMDNFGDNRPILIDQRYVT